MKAGTSGPQPASEHTKHELQSGGSDRQTERPFSLTLQQEITRTNQPSALLVSLLERSTEQHRVLSERCKNTNLYFSCLPRKNRVRSLFYFARDGTPRDDARHLHVNDDGHVQTRRAHDEPRSSERGSAVSAGAGAHARVHHLCSTHPM